MQVQIARPMDTAVSLLGHQAPYLIQTEHPCRPCRDFRLGPSMLVLSLGLLLALLPANIAGAISHFEPTSFRTGIFSLSAPRSPLFLCTRAHSKLCFSSSGMRMNAGTSADAHRPTSPGKADSLPDGFGRQLLWYTKCGDSCNTPEACESPCYCQPNSTGGASQKGNSQSQNMWGTCRPQSGLHLLIVLWCFEAPSSSCCMRRHTRWTELLLRTVLNVYHGGSDGCEWTSSLVVCLLAQQTARHRRA